MSAGDEISVLELAAGNSLPNTSMRKLLDLVENIDNNIQDLTEVNGGIPSQANARSFSGNARSTFRNRQNDRDGDTGTSLFGNRNNRSNLRRQARNSSRGFMDSFEDALLEGFIGSDFRRDVARIFQGFADQLGTDIRGIPGALGKQLGQSLMKSFKETDQGKQLTAQVDQLKKNFLGNLQKRGNDLVQRVVSGSLGQQGANAIQGSLSRFGTRPTAIGNFMQGAGAGLRGMWGAVRGTASAIRNAPGTIRSMFQPVEGEEVAQNATEESQSSEAARQASTSNTESTNFSEMSSSNAQVNSTVAQETSEMSVSGAIDGAIDNVEGSMSSLGSAMETVGEQVASGGASAVSGLIGIGPHGMAAAGALLAIELVSGRVMEAIKGIGEGLSQMWKAMGKAANRDKESQKQNLKLAKERMQADYETMVRYPFQLLKNAAEDLTNAWNQNLATVSATQGYNKSDVQDLMAAYAERIRDEGLSSYVSGADLFNNLANVLKSGLSGAIAEEFAYQATVLNKAVPTQDFFQYASTYSSIAANAIRDGKSQTEAIAEANESLNQFASSLLYTSRELTGGFSTGLTNASSIYAEASKIALAANSENLNAISSTLVAVQGYIGAVAPDLADSMVNVITKLATGGNSSETVALRSLAGINASNTEFLRALANDPQSVLSAMFDNLANMFTESSDAYMEKAEGYASLFGIDASAFQRVDFNELANAIRSMNLENESLNENMELLLEGQTTTTAEQLKAQQVNQYMIEEGLAYVIDNEVAQMIQQHMWDEQEKRELMEANYSVDLIGDSREGLLKIVQSVQKILDFLNPFSWLRKLGNVITTSMEADQQAADVRQMLLLGRVGGTSEQELAFAQLGVTDDLQLRRLTSSNTNLNLTRSLVDLMGGVSRYNKGSAQQTWSSITNAFGSSSVINTGSLLSLQSALNTYGANEAQSIAKPVSDYAWGFVSKSTAKLAKSVLSQSVDTVVDFITNATNTSSNSVTANSAKNAIDKMMDQTYIKDEFVKKGKSYEDWIASSSKFGIADLEQAAESAGYAMDDIKKFFEDTEAQAGQEEQHDRNLREEEFWKDGQNFWKNYFPTDFDPRLFTAIETMETEYLQKIIDRQDIIITRQDSIIGNQILFHTHWLGTGGNDSGAWGKWLNGAWPTWTGKDPKYTWSNFTEATYDFWGLGKKNESFKELYKTITDYMLNKAYYGVTGDIKDSELWKSLSKVDADTKAEERQSSADQIGKILSETLINGDKTDPALQTNVLLGQILVYVGQIVQQTNDAGGGSALISNLAAMSLGLTQPAQ